MHKQDLFNPHQGQIWLERVHLPSERCLGVGRAYNLGGDAPLPDTSSKRLLFEQTAAITSYDGVARSQTGNIDEYNKVHKWRKVHPMHHLADEESDITKWAFPENADFFLQRKL